jgi:hypothetical protein
METVGAVQLFFSDEHVEFIAPWRWKIKHLFFQRFPNLDSASSES